MINRLEFKKIDLINFLFTKTTLLLKTAKNLRKKLRKQNREKKRENREKKREKTREKYFFREFFRGFFREFFRGYIYFRFSYSKPFQGIKMLFWICVQELLLSRSLPRRATKPWWRSSPTCQNDEIWNVQGGATERSFRSSR